MKKVILIFSAIGILTFASCSSNSSTEATSTTTDSTVVLVDTFSVDSASTFATDTTK